MWFGPAASVAALPLTATRWGGGMELDRAKWAGAASGLTPAPGKAGRGMPGSPSLLWMAVAETIWAEDMEAMLWRALSFTAWSF